VATHGLLMVMSIEIASMLCHCVSQEAVDTGEQLDSTLIRHNADRCRYSCDVIDSAGELNCFIFQ